MPTPIPDDGGIAEPGASGASPSPTPTPAAGGAGQVQQSAPGNPDGPILDVSEPFGETVVQPGADLTATWTADSEGVWNPMTIQLMTGSNQQMIPLSTVGQNIDATTTTSYSFKVPDVEPYSQIYFLQLYVAFLPLISLTTAPRLVVRPRGRPVSPSRALTVRPPLPPTPRSSTARTSAGATASSRAVPPSSAPTPPAPAAFAPPASTVPA
jgi:hypothetical protein